MSLQTGLVSPQFHCSYDDLFETTTGTQARSIPKSQCQYKVGFVKEPNKQTIIRAEQEVGNIPFNAEVIPPICEDILHILPNFCKESPCKLYERMYSLLYII